MRILLVNYEFPPIGGGASRASFCIARELVGLGHEVVVLTSRFGDAASQEQIAGIEIHRVWSWRKGIHDCGLRGALTYLLSALPRLRRLINRHDFDVVHYFFGLPTGLLSAYSSGACGLPYIVSLRGSDVPGYDLASRKLRVLHGCSRWLSHRIWRNSAGVVAVSSSLRDLGQAVFPDVNVSVIHNGVDAPAGASTAEAAPGTAGRFRVVSVSRLIPRKGIGDLLRAMQGLEDVDFELSIAGSGHAEQDLADLAEELGIRERVTFLGYQSEAEVRQLYASADAFVLPTHSDAFANVILEAMSAGLPVIATDVGGAPEAIEHGINGLLVKPRDPQAIGEAIRRLAGDAALRRRMSSANLARVRRQFTWPAIARQYRDVYASAVKQAAPVAAG